MTDNRDLLLRYLDGDLPPAEIESVRGRLYREPDLRAQLDRLQALRQTLETNKADSFAPYFSERVLKRLAAPTSAQAESLYDAMKWVFARAAVASLLVAGALGTYNVLDYQGLGVAASVVDALFGLPSSSFSDALYYSGL